MNQVDRNEAFRRALEQANADLDAQFGATLNELFDAQRDVMDRVDNLVHRAADVDILQPQRQQAEGYQGQVTQLRAVQADLQAAITTRQGELRERAGDITALHTNLVHLTQARNAVPPPRHESLVALGDHMSQEISYSYRKGGK
jgi:hypothetical protein